LYVRSVKVTGGQHTAGFTVQNVAVPERLVMNKNKIDNKYVQKRLNAYKKYISARNNFIEKEKGIRKDLEECNRIIKDLNNKFEWSDSIP